MSPVPGLSVPLKDSQKGKLAYIRLAMLPCLSYYLGITVLALNSLLVGPIPARESPLSCSPRNGTETVMQNCHLES